MRRDLMSGTFEWQGNYLVNPWDRGRLVGLARLTTRGWPAYLGQHPELRDRHVAKKAPGSWHRTIDKVHAGLTRKPKLLLQDMKAHIHPVLEPGGHYPHHNLYYVVSDTWDMEVLGGLLLSRSPKRSSRRTACRCVAARCGSRPSTSSASGCPTRLPSHLTSRIACGSLPGPRHSGGYSSGRRRLRHRPGGIRACLMLVPQTRPRRQCDVLDEEGRPRWLSVGGVGRGTHLIVPPYASGCQLSTQGPWRARSTRRRGGRRKGMRPRLNCCTVPHLARDRHDRGMPSARLIGAEGVHHGQVFLTPRGLRRRRSG